MPLLLDQVERRISPHKKLIPNQDSSSLSKLKVSAPVNTEAYSITISLLVFLIGTLTLISSVMICLCVNRRSRRRREKNQRRASSAHPPDRNGHLSHHNAFTLLKRTLCDKLQGSSANSEVVNDGYEWDSTHSKEPASRGQSCDRSVELQSSSFDDEGPLTLNSPSGSRKTRPNRNTRFAMPTTWFPWTEKAVRTSMKRFNFLNVGTHQTLSNSNERSNRIEQVSPQYSNTQTPSECNTIRTNCTSHGRPAYQTQQSMTSSQYRELPPVPTDESGSSSPPSSYHLRLTRSQISASPNHVATLPECPSPTSHMDSVCAESHYDFLYGSNVALSPPQAPVMLDCRSNLEQDFDDSCSISEVDPFYSTIRRKQGACVNYPQDASVYTAASCSDSSIEHYGYCQNVLDEMQHRCGDEECNNVMCNRADISTGSSHYYSQICRPLKGDVLSAANCEYPLNMECLNAYRRQLRHKIRSVEQLDSNGDRPTSSGASLGIDLLKAGLAPVVVSEKDSFEEEVSVWSHSAHSNSAGPNLPTRAYGRSEVDLLLMLRGFEDHDGNTDELLDEALKDIWQSSGGQDDYNNSCHPHLSFRKFNGVRRPSLHDLLNYNRMSQAFISSCTDLPMNQPLMHAVTHFRQNSYSDHQLATSKASNCDTDITKSSNESASQCLKDPLTKESSQAEQQLKCQPAQTEHPMKEEVSDKKEKNKGERNTVVPSSLGSCFRTVWSPKTLPSERNTVELRELKLSVLPPLPPVLYPANQFESSRKPPSILYEMHTLRHMDSDIDLSATEPMRPCSPEQYHMLTPLMERSMESSCYYDTEADNDASINVTNVCGGYIHSRYSSGVGTHSSSSGYGASCMESPSCASLCTGDVPGPRPISLTSSDVTADSGSSPAVSSSSTSPLKCEQNSLRHQDNQQQLFALQSVCASQC